MVPVAGVDPPTTAFATEAYTPTAGPSISVPVPKQLGSASDRGLEIQLTVSDYVMLTIVVANYWSFSICLWPLIVHYRLRRPMPYCMYPLGNQNKISL